MSNGLYDGTLESIPGLGGYIQQTRINNQQTGANLQNAASVMQLVQAAKSAQEDDAIRQVLSQGGPPEQVVQSLLKTGPKGMDMASHYMTANNAMATQKALQGMNPTDPDAMEKASIALAISNPAASASLSTISKGLRDRQANVSESQAQQSQVAPLTETPTQGLRNGVLADRSMIAGLPPGIADPNLTNTAAGSTVKETLPPEVQAAMASGKPFSIAAGPQGNPADNVQRTGGLFSQFFNSPISAIQRTAVADQGQLDASNPQSIQPKAWETTATGLAGREATMIQHNDSLAQSRQQHEDSLTQARQLHEDSLRVNAAKGGLNPDGTPMEGAGLSQDAINAAAARYRIDGTLPTNVGRGIQGALDMRKILNTAAQQAADSGDTPEAQRITQLANKANAQALGQITKQETTLGAFEKNALMNADLALQASAKVDRTGVPVINRWIQAGRTAITGDPDARVFNASTSTFVSEYAKVMSGGSGASATTEGATHRAQDLLNTADTPESYAAVINQLKLEMANRMQGFAQQKSELMGGMGGKPAAQPTTAPAPAALQANQVQLPDGRVKTFPSPAAAQGFRKAAGL